MGGTSPALQPLPHEHLVPACVAADGPASARSEPQCQCPSDEANSSVKTISCEAGSYATSLATTLIQRAEDPGDVNLAAPQKRNTFSALGGEMCARKKS